MRKTTIDLEREAREIREERIPEVEETQDDLVEQIESEYDSYAEVPDELDTTYDKLEERRVELRGQSIALVTAILEWSSEYDLDEVEREHGSVEDFIEEHGVQDLGSSEFVVQELSTGQLADIQDRVSEKSFEFDPQEGKMVSGTPKQGYGMVETLREAVVRQPDGAPTRTDDLGHDLPEPAEYPNQVGMFLFEKVNSLNTVGDTDLGNSSLRERMKS